jgi:hypothetical protein
VILLDNTGIGHSGDSVPETLRLYGCNSHESASRHSRAQG